jgi:hypothetical protein
MYCFRLTLKILRVLMRGLIGFMQQKGHHGDLLLRVDMCCEACVKKVRRVLIELNGTDSKH